MVNITDRSIRRIFSHSHRGFSPVYKALAKPNAAGSRALTMTPRLRPGTLQHAVDHVTERTSEIGIRRDSNALGAQRRNVLLLIVSDGIELLGMGTAIGLAVAIVLTKVMTTLLFGLGPTADAFTLAVVSNGALAVA